MSRSKRKTPICGFTLASSDKWYKTFWHRVNRARLRVLLSHAQYEDAEAYTPYDDWSAPKDGKHWLSKSLIQRLPKLMRK